MRSAHAPEAGSPAGAWGRFRHWRRGRPFWGGLLLILSGVELFLSGNLNPGALQLHIGPTGFLSYVIPAMLVLCGAGTWMTPNVRLFYGILGSLVAVYSLIGVNLGGFLVGLLLGIIGGALSIAWTPVPITTPTAGASDLDDEPYDAEPATESDDAVADRADYPPVPAQAVEQGTEPQPRYDHGHPYGNVPAYGDTAEIPRQVQDPERWWGPSESGPRRGEEEPPPYGSSSGSNHTRMLAITLVPVTLAAVLLTVVNQPTAASAAPCPTPKVSASATPKPSPSKSGQATALQNGAASGNAHPAPSGSATASPSASPSSAASKSSGNPLVNAWNGLVDGVSKLFGGGKESTPADTPSQSPSPSPSASASSVLPGLPGLPALPALPSLAGSGSSRPQASKSASTGSCITSAAVEAGQPSVALTPGLLTGSSQVMKDFKYVGVTDLPTKTGTMRVLKFTMSNAVTTPFSLKVPERNGRTTVITSTELTTDRDVTFYTPKFTGTLLSVTPPLIPIPLDFLKLLNLRLTFTPDSPPPLPPIAVPSIEFGDVSLDLAFVHCRTLTGKALHISEV